ncbi:MAG: rhomboid family intramembrane serine protease [Sandaracinaceae bacterium]
MIPLRDINPTLRRPYATYALIAINVAAWLYEVALGGAAEPFIQRWGVVPYYLVQAPSLGSWLTPLTSMFLHGGWMHLIGNMWFLYVFGDNIEDALGRTRYVLFYLLTGLTAVAAQVVIDPHSTVPMVGASGAIAGVLGAYLMLHPRARVVTLVPIFIFIQFVELPAWVFLFVWIGLQLLQGFTSLGDLTGGGGVAFFAHIGGFAAGVALIRLFLRTRPPETERVVRPELRRNHAARARW